MEQTKRKGVAKGALFFIFIILCVVLFKFTPIHEYVDAERIRTWVAGFGKLAPLVFIVIYAAGISLFLPATVFTGIGALLFGAFWGFMFNIAGAMLGASMGFFIGRYLGRDFATSLIGERLKQYDKKIAERGFATTLYLRLVFFPFTPLNFGMGLTSIRFMDFFTGTLLGIIAGGFAMTFFFATLAEVWASEEWIMLASWKSMLAAILFVGSFFIPTVVKKIRPEV